MVGGATIALLAAESADPNSYLEATYGPEQDAWRESVNEEYSSSMENECWELVARPLNVNVIHSKRVFKTKEEQTCNRPLGLQRKSRLVAGGNNQIEGIDYFATYAPVVKFISVRTLLAIVSMLCLLLRQMDVKTAFLNGDLDEILYMEQPRDFEKGDPEKIICRLKKSLHGLKQAPRYWYAKIDNFLLHTFGMSRNLADECVYIRS